MKPELVAYRSTTNNWLHDATTDDQVPILFTLLRSSSPRSQMAATAPYPELLNRIHTLPSYFPQTDFIVVHPSKISSRKEPHFFRLPDGTSALSFSPEHAACPVHSILIHIVRPVMS
jgi:hypothetical protein